MPCVLVTPRSFSEGKNPALTALEAQGYELIMPAPGRLPSEADLIAAIPNCCGWIAGVEPVSPAVIAAADRLKVISRNGSGVDNLPMDAISARDIAVCHAGGANARAVAELALTLALAALRHVPLTDRLFRQGDWSRRIGREIGAASVGIIGLGAIGQQAARLFAPLAGGVVGFDPFQPADVLSDVAGFTRTGSLEEVLSKADLITLHLPAGKNGQPVLDAGALAAMRPDAVLVNTARAALVDEQALLAALESGQISVYAADVFDQEPPDMTPLLCHQNTILTSHIGGYTKECVRRIAETTVNNLLEVLRHEKSGQ